MKKLTLILLSLIVLNNAMAQEKNNWSLHKGLTKIITEKAVARLSFPKEFKLFDLNIEPLRQNLMTVVDKHALKHSTIISLPNADGQIEQFEVFEASNFEPDLQAQFPDIRSFSGRGITDKAATLKLSISPQGIQTMVFRTDKENEFIEPYSQNHTVYAVFKSRRNPKQLPWTCGTQDQRLASAVTSQVAAAANSGSTARSGANLKTLRLAQSVTAEYSNYFGATSASQVALVLAAINATLTRCNGVYEKDLAVHLNLVAASTNVIYYNASTDPYDVASTGVNGSWNTQLQATLTSVIGEANYDIGHLFGASGGGGNAGCIGCICVNGSKGSGFTSPADGIPQGDNFDIDYVVHEVGHQLGANHTFSYSNEGTGVQDEIGSGITIMGYAGITSYDVAAHSIDIYHEASIAQIQANLLTKTCPATVSITNTAPVVAAVSNYTIPKSTPFALTGSATDADASNVLTYCWEQNNDGSSKTGANSKASATKTTGPNWISFKPTTSPTRYFPQLSTILAGGLTTGPLTGGDAGITTEALSSVARTLNFRLTVRDNAPYSSTAPISTGQTNFTDMVVTVNAASGPFAVTVPNTGVIYAGGSTQTITWSVASTTASPVSCTNVKISLSTDGGQTFPTVLAASTPNDGTEALVIPNIATTTARIKVEAVGNIFFDISDANFTITSAASCGDPATLASSAVTTTTATVNWAAVTNAVSYAVDYKLNSSSTWTSFSTAQTGTSASLINLTSSSLHDWRVKATCIAGTGNYVAAQFTTLVPCMAPSDLSSTPASTTATVSWTAVTAATNYAVDYKLNSSTTWISFSTVQTGTSASLTGLTASSLYDWRVSATCPSGKTAATAAQFTTTASPVCIAVTGLTATAVTSTSATISWTASGSAVSYAVDYKLDTASVWKSFSTAQTSVSANLTGLAASSLYDCRVTTNCSFGSSTAVVAQFTTTVPPACTVPTALTSSAITSSSATVSWTASASAVSYAVDYKLNTSSTWVSFSTVQTGVSASLTGLVAASLYDWRVTANCSSGSSIAVGAQFTTSAASTCATAFEPNGTQATAAAITTGVANSAAISSSTDIDYYSITTTGTNNIVYNLVGPSGVDYDLYVYNSAGTQLGVSNGTTATETVSLSNQAAGTYYIKVIGYSGATSATCYTIKATTTTVVSCQSTYDVSTNGTTAGAATVPFNTNITGMVTPTADIDDYKFAITTAGTITLTLTTLPADYDLKLLNSAGTQVSISQNSGTATETIKYTAAAGTYYAQVFGYNGANSATTCYTLKVALGTASKEDGTESMDNNPVNPNKQLVELYPSPVHGVLNININGASGLSEIRVYDINGSQAITKKTNQANTSVDVSKLAAGIYLVKVMNGNTVISSNKIVKE